MSTNPPLTALSEWRALIDHKATLEGEHIKDLFAADPARFDNMHVDLDGLVFDYSRHKATDKTVSLLCDLAKARGFESLRKNMVSGAAINASEHRSVLHMALRGSVDENLDIDGVNVSHFVNGVLGHMQMLAELVSAQKHITTVINIGIGGSDLGPRMVYKALRPFRNDIDVHFVSNIDGRALDSALDGLSPENTLFVITSKTFTTLETLTNARTAKTWFLENSAGQDFADHVLAVTMNEKAAKDFGVLQENILNLKDWVGGRFSLWGAVGISLVLAYGFENFSKLLAGAKAMDSHFLNAPLEKNIPVIMGLLGVWYRNFWHYPSKAILPYAHDLRDLPKYLQQLDMESNGKSVDRDGTPVCTSTGSVIFGEAGTNSQHAFMQLLHQGTEIIPADFVVIANAEHEHETHHQKLISNALAQSKALMEGREATEGESYRAFAGNRPSSTLLLKRLDPFHLGMLIALYEHVVFVQGAIWGINSFDQWGVELGKDLAKHIDAKTQSEDNDPSTIGLINKIKNLSA